MNISQLEINSIVYGQKSIYRIDKVLGHGAISEVLLATNLRRGPGDSEQVAIKILKNTTYVGNEVNKYFQEELGTIRRLCCENRFEHIVNIFEVIEYLNNSYLIVMEYCQHAQLTQGLSFLHGIGIIHRDLKPENVFIHEKDTMFILKIGDYGLGKMESMQSMMQSCVGTINYMAPEMVQNQLYDFSVDTWALGCIFHELFTGEQLFADFTAADIAIQIKTFTGYKCVYGRFGNIIARCLDPVPSRRISVIELYNQLYNLYSDIISGKEDSRSNFIVHKSYTLQKNASQQFYQNINHFQNEPQYSFPQQLQGTQNTGWNSDATSVPFQRSQIPGPIPEQQQQLNNQYQNQLQNSNNIIQFEQQQHQLHQAQQLQFMNTTPENNLKSQNAESTCLEINKFFISPPLQTSQTKQGQIGYLTSEFHPQGIPNQENTKFPPASEMFESSNLQSKKLIEENEQRSSTIEGNYQMKSVDHQNLISCPSHGQLRKKKGSIRKTSFPLNTTGISLVEDNEAQLVLRKKAQQHSKKDRVSHQNHSIQAAHLSNMRCNYKHKKEKDNSIKKVFRQANSQIFEMSDSLINPQTDHASTIDSINPSPFKDLTVSVPQSPYSPLQEHISPNFKISNIDQQAVQYSFKQPYLTLFSDNNQNFIPKSDTIYSPANPNFYSTVESNNNCYSFNNPNSFHISSSNNNNIIIPSNIPYFTEDNNIFTTGQQFPYELQTQQLNNQPVFF